MIPGDIASLPFNRPVELWSHNVAGGIAAGNAVISKTPEDCPLSVIEISKYDADIATTADALVAGRFTSGNGQICCAVKRVLVTRPIYERLHEMAKELTLLLHEIFGIAG